MRLQVFNLFWQLKLRILNFPLKLHNDKPLRSFDQGIHIPAAVRIFWGINHNLLQNLRMRRFFLLQRVKKLQKLSSGEAFIGDPADVFFVVQALQYKIKTRSCHAFYVLVSPSSFFSLLQLPRAEIFLLRVRKKPIPNTSLFIVFEV